MEIQPRELPNGNLAYPKYICYKFQSKNILLDLQKNGHIFMKCLEYYIELEKETGDSSIGDAKEALSFNSSIKLVSDNNSKVIDFGKCDVRIGNDIKKPVFCLTCVDVLDYIIDFSYPIVECNPSFDKKILSAFSKTGDDLYVLMIDLYSFHDKIKSQLDKMNIQFDCGFVKYRNTNIFYKDGENITINGPFNKREIYSYQKEFRYLIEKNINCTEYFDFYIGDISDISYLCKAKELFENKYKYIFTFDE